MSITLRGKHRSGFTVDVLEAFTFPAGEAHIKGFDTLKVEDYEYFIADIRGHDPQDLFHLNMWAAGLDAFGTVATGFPKKYVLLPYIPGARADRTAPTQGPFGAQVYATFINGLFLDGVVVVDPHSPVAPSLYENGERFPSSNLIEFPFERIIKRELGGIDSGYVGVIAPDNGAHDRAARAAAVLHVPVYTAGKTRDFETGKLTGFHMEDELPAEGKFLLVDDICDGGGTFVGLALAIKQTNPKVKLDLWVTHGIFSKGLKDLLPWFGTIHTTDSYDNNLTGAAFSLIGNSYVPEGGKYGDQFKVHTLTPYLYAEVTNIHNKDAE
jgi:ribose-phosphate pyrophosphokinase